MILDAKKLVARLSRLTESVETLEKAVAYAFVSKNNYDTSSSVFLNSYFYGLDFSIAKKALVNTPDIRADKVQSLKAQIDAGTYNVTGMDVANKLFAQLT